MKNKIEKATRLGLPKKDAVYISKLNSKTKSDALNFFKSEKYSTFGHWGQGFDMNEIDDPELIRIINESSNHKREPYLSMVSHQANLMEPGFKKLIFKLISFPARIMPSTYTKIHAIKMLLEN